MEHKFTLFYDLAEQAMDAGLEISKLAEAGCTNAFVGLGAAGRVRLEFVREAECREGAILSAMARVSRALPEATQIEAESSGVPDSLTREQAAKVLHLSPTFVDELVRVGRLACHKTGSADVQSRPPMFAWEEVLRCWRETKESQARGLDAMTQATERLGLYERELTETPALADVLVRQARSLPVLLERLAKATEPDSIDRAELAARVEKLLEWFEEPVDEESVEPRGQTTKDAIADAKSGATKPTSLDDL